MIDTGEGMDCGPACRSGGRTPPPYFIKNAIIQFCQGGGLPGLLIVTSDRVQSNLRMPSYI